MRDPAKTFEDFVVWQKAHQFVLAVYRFFADISAVGNLRLVISISPRRCIHCREHRGKIQKTRESRQTPFS